MQTRQVDLIFGFIFSGLSAIIAYGFFKDFVREECKNDKRYTHMAKISQVIMFLVAVSGLYLFVLAIAMCHKRCQTIKKLRKNPPELSSDEEDDKEFLANLEEDRAAQELEFGAPGGGGA